MAKLAIATVTYRFYTRIEDDNADLVDMRMRLDFDYETAVSENLHKPVNKVIWEWHGDKIDPQFMDEMAYGENPDGLSVREVAKEHRSLNFNPEKDNPSPT
jgi:hypothetical protein